MPIEYILLRDQPSPIPSCPFCGEKPFDPFLRGMVVSGWRRFWGRPCWCLICSRCKQIVGYEAVPVNAGENKTLQDRLAYNFGLFKNKFSGRED